MDTLGLTKWCVDGRRRCSSFRRGEPTLAGVGKGGTRATGVRVSEPEPAESTALIWFAKARADPLIFSLDRVSRTPTPDQCRVATGRAGSMRLGDNMLQKK